MATATHLPATIPPPLHFSVMYPSPMGHSRPDAVPQAPPPILTVRLSIYSKPMPFALQDRNPIQIPHAAFRPGPWLGVLVRCCFYWLHVSMGLLGLFAAMASNSSGGPFYPNPRENHGVGCVVVFPQKLSLVPIPYVCFSQYMGVRVNGHPVAMDCQYMFASLAPEPPGTIQGKTLG